ncbi:MAG: SufD family Fe-S cluster assembly protein [Burkholderiales bacterium]|nr:SufD family Fe-S cluster assembly protein [Burkholderiales bacterium]
MDSALADRLAARHHLHTQGWIGRRSEHFRHLPPPALDDWIGPDADAPACAAPTLSGSGWLLQPVGPSAAAGVDARWLDALDPTQRSTLFAGLPNPGDDDASAFAWAHRALCRQGLRLRIHTPPGKAAADCDTVWLHLRHQPRDTVEAPLLVLDLEAGVRCVLIETHERTPSTCGHALVQNLHTHIHLAEGAQLQHLRLAQPQSSDRMAQHVHARLAQGAHYTQALVATGASYHLQRTTLQLQAPSAQAHTAALLLPAGQVLEQQVHTRLDAAHTRAHTEVLALAAGRERVVANAHSRIAPGAHEAQVRQRLNGVALGGQPRMVLRPHLEILHDQVQAAHGATWGRLPEDALFYALQRGLDDAQARALITEGMARAVLERALDTGDGAQALAQWLESGVLAQALARELQAEVPHVA